MRRIKRYAPWIFKAFLPIGLYAFMWLRNCLPADRWDQNGWVCMALGVGGSFSPYANDTITLLLSMVPQLVILYLYAGYFRQDFIISYTYVFTRYGKKSRWFFGRLRGLFLLVTFQYLLLYLAAFLFGLSAGYAFSPSFEMIGMLGQSFLLNVLVTFLFVFGTNLLSMPFGETRACLFSIILYVFTFSGAVFIAQMQNSALSWLLYALPAANAQVLWHFDRILPVQIQAFVSDIPAFSVMGSLCVTILEILCVIALFRCALERRDLNELIGGVR